MTHAQLNSYELITDPIIIAKILLYVTQYKKNHIETEVKARRKQTRTRV